MSYVTGKFDDRVVELLQAGGVGFIPSDTLYGLSARALDEQAVEKVHRLKERDSDKPCIVLISDVKMLNMLSISPELANPVESYWPGAISIIFPTTTTPDYLTCGTNSLAVRVPNFPELLDLINKVGPIISTSANLQGREPAKSALDAKKIFGDRLNFYVDVGKLNNEPSTLVRAAGGKLEVLRPGAVKIKP